MRILVFRLSAIGDIILTSALIRCLKKQIPDCTIDFVVKRQFEQLVSSNPHISTIYTVDSNEGFSGLRSLAKNLQTKKYDVFLDIHKNFRSQFVRRKSNPQKIFTYKKHVIKRALLINFHVDLYNPPVPVYKRFILSAEALGIKDDGEKTEFYIDHLAQEKIDGLLATKGAEPLTYITLCPGASFWNKQWPIENLSLLATKIIQQTDKNVVLIGGPKEKELSAQIASANPKVIDLTGKLNLQESAAVLKNTLCTVANDTGMLHLSEALKRPVVGIYGPTARQLGYFPLLEESQIVEVEDLACRPCTKMGMNNCPKKHFKCMRDINPEHVFNAIKKYL